MIAPEGNVYFIGVSVPLKNTGFPLESSIDACGLNDVVELDCFFVSVIIIFDKPVMSSTCSEVVTPSMKSSNCIIPLASATIGCVCGSHVEIISPLLTF